MGACQRRSLAYCFLLLVCRLTLPLFVEAQGFCPYRMREHTTDCTVLTDGQECDLCYEHDSSRLWKCVPTVVGEPCSGAEWKEIKFVVTDADVPNTITVTLAATATALATDPTACPGGQFVSDIAATGTLTCNTPPGGTDANAIHGNASGEIAAITDKATPVAGDHLLIEDSAVANAKKDITIGTIPLSILAGAVTDAQVPNTITIDLAATATALAANPTDCSANQFATAIAANGTLTCAALTDADVPNTITISLAATATALAADPAACPAGQYVSDIAANGTLTCSTPPGGGLTAADIDTSLELGNILQDDTGTGAFVRGTSPTIATPVLTLENGSGAPPTTTGQLKFDRTTKYLQVGDTGDTQEFVPVGALTDTNLCTWNLTAGVMQCTTPPTSGLGDVVGPASSTLNAIARYSSNTGKALKDSSVTVSDTGIITAAGYETAAVSTSGGLLRLCEDGDLDPENDCVVLRVPDGLNIPDNDTVHDVRADGKFKATMIAGSYLITNSKAASYTLGTDDAMELYGGVIYVTAAATMTLPVVAPGMNFSVITIGAVAVSIDPNSADTIWLDGVTTGTAGDKITNTSTTGDMAVCTYRAANTWYCATGSNDGDPWTDTGP